MVCLNLIYQNTKFLNLLFMTQQNTNQSTINTAYVINPTSGEVNVVVSQKAEVKIEKEVKAVPKFAKNLRYSLNSNGGGYRGL